jgi:hypothetical protein
MKTKKQQKDHKPFHLHIEHFFRRQYVVYAVLALVGIGLCKADNRLLTVMHTAYAEGFHSVGEHMREETTRMPMHLNMTARIPTISGH